MSYINSLQIDNGTTHLIEPTLYAATGGTAAALTATIANFELAAGVAITLKITTSNAANATLSINGTTAKNIYYKNAAITANILKVDNIYNFVYDGTTWHVIGEKLSDSEMILPHKLTFGAGGAYVYDGSADVTVPVYTGTTL